MLRHRCGMVVASIASGPGLVRPLASIASPVFQLRPRTVPSLHLALDRRGYAARSTARRVPAEELATFKGPLDAIPLPPNTKIRGFRVGDNVRSIPLVDFLVEQLQLSNSMVRLKIMNKEVDVVGTAHSRNLAIRTRTELVSGDVVRVLMPEGKAAENLKSEALMMKRKIQALRQRILYKDQHIIIINKPTGLAVQDGSKLSTNLTDILEGDLGLRFSSEDPPRLVHRLDKGTTGCMVIARTKEAAAKMSAYLRPGNDNVIKKYWALLCGKPVTAQGLIRTGIVKEVRQGMEKMGVTEWLDTDEGTSLKEGETDVKLAETYFKQLAGSEWFSLVEFKPKTGRKHQIRVHASRVLRAPIVGDYKYGPGMTPQLRNLFKKIKVAQLSLHMREIQIKDWFGPGKNLVVKAPVPSHMYLPMANAKMPPKLFQDAEREFMPIKTKENTDLDVLVPAIARTAEGLDPAAKKIAPTASKEVTEEYEEVENIEAGAIVETRASGEEGAEEVAADEGNQSSRDAGEVSADEARQNSSSVTAREPEAAAI
ncbi:pseudouridine synthase [Zopfochytrium polystomum]|nr:pseudouridine synthase [Zopfochytrium polystomum]